MGILDYVELGLSTVFASAKGHDAKGFVKGPAFKDFPEPTFTVESPDCGPSGSTLDKEYTQLGADKFPELKWSSPSPDIKEYLVVIEDPDAPLPTPANHGFFYAIPPSKTSIVAADIESLKDAKEPNVLAGGFKHGKNIRGLKYSGARPLLGHGPHRYWYTIVALKEPLDEKKFSAIPPKRSEVSTAITGKVAGWGRWEGVYERKWQ